jgi:hypothetical protein
LPSLRGANVIWLACDSQVQISILPQTAAMADQSNPSAPNDRAARGSAPDNFVDEEGEAAEQIDTGPRNKTYTVIGLLQAHVPRTSLGRYVKAR